MQNIKRNSLGKENLVGSKTKIGRDSSEPFQNTVDEQKSPTQKGNKFIVSAIIILILLAGAAYLFKDTFIAAIVNNRPIFRYQLSQRLSATYGKETLENMIIENLIREEAAKKSVVIKEDDIDKEIEKLEKGLGAGTKLEDVLKYQGVSLAEFKNQLKLRLQVNRILEKDVSVTSEEIDKYLKDNAKTMVATGEAEKKVEAQEKIAEQKVNDKVQTWISELLAKAKITRLLK